MQHVVHCFNFILRRFVLFAFCFLLSGQLQAQLVVNSLYEEVVINFEETIPGVLNGQYEGLGFSANPAPGQLNSNAWSVTGLSGGDVPFGGNGTTGSYAMGVADHGVVTAGGIYAHPASGLSSKLMFQPDDNELNPGSIILKVQNNTGRQVDYIRTAFIYERFQDQSNSTKITFEISNDSMTTWVEEWSHTSSTVPQSGSNLLFMNPRLFTQIDIADGEYIYLRWKIEAVSGTGERDELYLNNISVIMMDLDGYCLKEFNQNQNDAGITLFSLANVNNPSGIDPIAYSDFTDQVIQVVAGETYNLQLRTGLNTSSHTPSAAVYADFNKNKSFEDPGENLTGFYNFPNNSIQNISVTIPADADTGVTRLRVVAVRNTNNNPFPCDFVFWGESEDYSIRVFPAGTCLPITKLTLDAHYPNLGIAEWQAGGNENGWNLEAGLPGFTPGTGNAVTATTHTTPPNNIFGGLQPGTAYEIYVRGNCSGNFSEWVGPLAFHTPMVTFSNENIETFTVSTVDSLSWFSIPQQDWSLQNGYMESATPGSLLVSPAVDLATDYIIRWEARNANAGTENTYRVWMTTNGYIHPDKYDILLGTYTSTSDSWESFTVSLSDYANERAFFAIEHLNAGAAPLYITNLAIVPFDCDMVEEISVDEITAHDAEINWTPADGQNQWLVEVGLSGFTPGNQEAFFTETVTTDTFTLVENLPDNTAFGVYVRSLCGFSGDSEWKGPETFTTLCGIDTPEYAATFSGNAIPECWWTARSSQAAPSLIQQFSSSVWAYAEESALVNFTDQRNDYLISKAVDLGDGSVNYQLEFEIRMRSVSANVPSTFNSNESFQVRLSPDVDQSSNIFFNLSDTVFVTDASNPVEWEWKRKVIDLTGFTGPQMVGFLALSSNFQQNSSNSRVYIRDFRIREVPTCTEVLNPQVDSVTNQSATISWENPAGANEWLIEYGVAGFALGSGNLISTTTHPVLISGLTENTAYEAYLRAVCGTDTTAYTWKVPFRTIGAGNNCSDPIIVNVPGDLPYIDLNQSTFNRGNDHFNTCLAFDNGEEIIYALNVTETTALRILLETNIGNISMAVMSSCPQSSACLYTIYTTGMLVDREQFFTPGTYYIYINKVPEPFYIPQFDLTLEVVECAKPTGLSADNIQPDAADINWLHTSNLDSFNIEVSEGAFTPGSGNVLYSFSNVGVPPFQLTGLNSGTVHVAYVQAVCSSGETDWVGPLSFQTLTDCPQTVNVTTVDEFADGALVSWDGIADAASWEVEVGAAGFTPGDNDFIQIYTSVTDTFLTISGLDANADYDFYVRADCTDTLGMWSAKGQFETICPEISVDLGADFSVCSNAFPVMLDAGAGFETYSWSHDLNLNQQMATINQAGTYAVTVTDAFDCSASDTIVITENPIAETFLQDTICDGETYNFGAAQLNTAGNYIDTLTAVNGCDSIVELMLIVLPTSSAQLSAIICPGDTLDFFGTPLYESGNYQQVLTAANGCDSIVHLSLTVEPDFLTVLTDTICAGDTLDFYGTALFESGIYQETFTSQNGCDSIIELHLTVNPGFTTTASASLCEGDTLDFFGTEITESGLYSHVLTAENGCDSIVELQVNTITYNTELTDTICAGDTLDFFGNSLTSAGLYTEVLSSQLGCDSVIELSLFVNPAFLEIFNDTICTGEEVEFYGSTLTESGTYTQTFSSVAGCDSIMQLDLIVLTGDTVFMQESICANQSFSFFGDSLTQAGTYTHIDSNTVGCESVYMLDLSVDPLHTVMLSDTICASDTLDFYGNALTTSGSYQHIAASAVGCDTIVDLVLTVEPVFATNLSASICSGDTLDFFGTSLFEAGVFNETLTAQNGCDSIIELTLTVNPAYFTPLTAKICEGDSLGFFEQQLKTSGVYFETLATVEGCDSIIQLQLDVLPEINTVIHDTICSGDSYLFDGQTLQNPGHYTATYTAVAGCDSIVELYLAVLSTELSQQQETICSGDSLLFFGNYVSQAGVYTHTLTAQNGCDSIVELELNVLDTHLTEMEVEICAGEIYDFLVLS
jgi:hypothetical protein